MKYKINLLEQKSDGKGFLKKLNYFFFNYFRYILVITQLIVISVLFYRFTIDQNIINLKEEIDQQESMLKVIKPIIDESQVIDSKIKKAKDILNNQDIFRNQLIYLLPNFPSTIFLDKLSFTKESVHMEGMILNPIELQAFFNKVKKDNKYKEVVLSNISKSDQGYLFSMSLNEFKN